MKNLKRTLAFMLTLAMLVTALAVPMTASAQCDHSYVYTLAKVPTESADGERTGVCSKCGDTVTETMKGMLTDIDSTPDGGYKFGNTNSNVGAILNDTPVSDQAIDFVKDLGGVANDPTAGENNRLVLYEYLRQQKDYGYNVSHEEVISEISFGEGVFYFDDAFRMNVFQDGSWKYYGRFTFNGVKDKTTFVIDDTTATEKGMFTSVNNKTWSMLYGSLVDITFMTKTFKDTGKPSQTINFVDGGVQENGNNLCLNLWQFKMNNCTVKGFNSLFTGCSSLTGPYLTNNTYTDFADAAFQGCGLVDMKVTNNIFEAYGYKTDDGYEPSYFMPQSTFCAGIISNNKISNMVFDGTNRAGRRQLTGQSTTTFSNNTCDRVYGLKNIDSISGNIFARCSKKDMTDFLETKGTVSSTYTSADAIVIESAASVNKFSADDMTGTYLMSSDCGQATENAYKFGKIGCDHLFKNNKIQNSFNHTDIDLSAFPLSYVPANTYYSGTHLNLNGASVYVRVNNTTSNKMAYGCTSLFDADGNDIGYTDCAVPGYGSWTAVGSGKTRKVLSDERMNIKFTAATSASGGDRAVCTYTIENFDVNAYYRFSTEGDAEVLSGNCETVSYSVDFYNKDGSFATINGKRIQSIYAGFNAADGMIYKAGGGSEPALYNAKITVLVGSTKASSSSPVEVVVPPIKVEKYNGMSNGGSKGINKVKTAVDYTAAGADYDTVAAAINAKTSFNNPDKIEKVYFNEKFGDLRKITYGGKDYYDDTIALQTALNYVKDKNMELVIERGTYNFAYNRDLAYAGYKTGSIYLEGGSTYRVRGLEDVMINSSGSDMKSGAFFYQEGEGDVSGYMINIRNVQNSYTSSESGSVFYGINFKNFMFDKCMLGGGYSLFDNCNIESSIFQGGYLSKSVRQFYNSYIHNSLFIDNYCHIGWVKSQEEGDTSRTDVGWLFYNTGFVNSTFQNNWSEFMRFSDGSWYENNGYPATNSLYIGNLLDYTTEIRLGAGDIAISNANYHSSKWNLRWNDKGITNPTKSMETRSVGTYHLSSGASVIANCFSENAEDSPAIYFEGKTTKANANGTKALKNMTVFGNRYNYSNNTSNNIFTTEGQLLAKYPQFDLDDTCLYKTLDAKNSTGNYINYGITFLHAPEYVIPGTCMNDGDMTAVLSTSQTADSISGTKGGIISDSMLVDYKGEAYYNGGKTVYPPVTLKDGDYTLVYGKDYTYFDNTIVGEGKIADNVTCKLVGIGKYTGIITLTYSIVVAPMDICTAVLEYNTVKYDGTAKKPAVKYVYRGTSVVSTSDYTVSYVGNMNGTAYAVITGSGTNYTGELWVPFTITGSTHKFVSTSVVAPTCTAPGYTVYKCSDSGCSVTYNGDYKKALGHNMQIADGYDQAPTCSTAGYKGYVCANGCGKSEIVNIDRISHVYRNYVKKATCLEGGETGIKCAVCGDKTVYTTSEATGHIKTKTVKTEGNCKTAAAVSEVCTECGATVSSTDLAIDENAHVWNIEKMITEPTCKTSGVASATCSVCGTHDDNAVIKATGHTPGEWVTSGSEKERYCTVCKQKINQRTVYSWDFTDKSTAAASAAEFNSLSELNINTSKNTYSSDKNSYVIPYYGKGAYTVMTQSIPTDGSFAVADISVKGDPYWNNITVPGVVFATDSNGAYVYRLYINEVGSIAEEIYYLQYNKSGTTVKGVGSRWSLKPKTLPLPLTGKSYKTGETITSKSVSDFVKAAPTMNGQKYATYDYHLNVENGVITVSADINYSFKSNEHSDAVEFSVTTAERSFDLDIITANASTYSDTNFADKTTVKHTDFKPQFGLYNYTFNTLLENQEGTAELFGATVEYELPASGSTCEHLNTKTVPAVAATCETAGRTEEIICIDCGKTLSGGQATKALGHDYVTKRTDATCTVDGKIVTTCSRCDYVSETVLPAEGHKFADAVVTKPATCTETGEETGTCTVCGETTAKTIPALGHNWGEWTVTTPATTTSEGTKTRTCLRCAETQTEKIPMLSGDIAFDWDYTDTSKGADDLDDMLSKSELVNSAKADNFVYNNDGYLAISGGSNFSGAVFTTPTGYAPSSLTVLAPNSYRETSALQYETAGAVIGKTVSGTGDNAVTGICQVVVASKTYGASLHITNKSATYDGSGFRKSINLNLKSVETGEYVGNSYKNAFGIDIAAANYDRLVYKYDITVDNDGNVTVTVTVKYTDPDTGTAYETEAEPITINLAVLQAANSSVTAFTPAFGVARCLEFNNDSNPAKLYGVTAVYTKDGSAPSCEHKNTKTIAAVAATCTTAGKTEEVVCADCGAHISGGETTKALGHDYKTVTVESTCTVKGSTTTTCSRCDYKDVKELPLKDHTAAAERKGVKAATCTAEGYTGDVVCKDCGTVIEAGKTIAKADHTPSDWIIDTPATSTSDGSKHTECTVCGTVLETEVIPATGVVYGDLNGDGVVDTNDAMFVLRYDARSLTLSDAQLTIADVNGDGVVDTNDAILILQYDAKIITEFPVKSTAELPIDEY